jgi:adenine-specific DNA-methyltransferase
MPLNLTISFYPATGAAWFLDTHSSGKCFHVCQAFFPCTSAMKNLKNLQ